MRKTDRKTRRRLIRVMMFALARGVAYTAGGAAVTALVYWAQR